MVWLVVVLSVWLVVSATTALRPSRKGAFASLSFPVGWAAGELPVLGIAIEVVLLGLLHWWGWPTSHVLSTLVVIVAAIVLIENLLLLGLQLSSGAIVARQLRRTPWRPITRKELPKGEFLTWRRNLMAVPLHPSWVQIIRDVHYGPFSRQVLDIWRTSTTPTNAPVMLYIHGGSWGFGEKGQQSRPMLHELVARGWIVVSVNYRLAPMHPWPAQMNDVTRALGWVKRHIKTYGGDPTRIVVAGASAGGQLAGLLALTHDDPTWRPEGYDDIADWRVNAAVVLYGVLEMTGDEAIWRGLGQGLRHLLEHRVVQQSFAEHEALYRSISPVERITEEAPPFLVVQGVTDTLVDVGVARHFVATFRQRAVAECHYLELPFTQHSFDLSMSPRTAATARAIAAFAERHVETKPALSSSLLESYAAPPTVVEVQLPTGEWASVTGSGRKGFVITAHNPFSQLSSHDVNISTTDELGRRLRERGFDIVPTRARSFDGKWPDELGWLAQEMTRNEARAWARAYRQFAIYEVTGRSISVIDAWSDAEY